MQTLNVLDNRFSKFDTYSRLNTEGIITENLTQLLFDNKQVIAIMNQLQTTLDVDEILTILSNEAARYIDFSGLYFKNKQVSKTMRGSKRAKKESSFDLKIDDQFIGTLSYGINAPINLTNYRVLEQLHQCFLHPLKNAITYYTAMQLAMQDALTGLGNRRYFDAQLKRAMHNANRYHSLVGLVLGDLNKFKSINDNFGHNTGDQVLKEFASILRQCIRESDSLFRFGGDEFAVIVENANENALTLIEQRVNLALTNNTLLSKYQLGCSLGSTLMTSSDNEESFFERADEMLYRSKVQLTTRLSVV
jgi:diguanylate cyclase (GGDEF)-like protein